MNYPICSMYDIFTYIWVIFRANVGKYSSTMEHMGHVSGVYPTTYNWLVCYDMVRIARSTHHHRDVGKSWTLKWPSSYRCERYWLAVDLPIWKICESQLGWWMEWKNNPNVPNHQPVEPPYAKYQSVRIIIPNWMKKKWSKPPTRIEVQITVISAHLRT